MWIDWNNWLFKTYLLPADLEWTQAMSVYYKICKKWKVNIGILIKNVDVKILYFEKNCKIVDKINLRNECSWKDIT